MQIGVVGRSEEAENGRSASNRLHATKGRMKGSTSDSDAPLRVPVPFLKWAGGKSIIADKVIQRLGPIPDGGTYFESFLGGGAVFFRFRPPRAVLLDSNVVLIRTYRVVKDLTEALIEELQNLPAPATKQRFEDRREDFNALLPVPSADASLGRDDVRRAALMIWLNHTGYNGLYRVNQDGKYNVPYGYAEKPFIFDSDNLRAASAALKRSDVKLIADDYAVVLALTKPGDVLYFDPPYHPPEDTPGFTSYTQEGFGPLDQERLAAVVQRLIEKGCRPVVSNSLNPNIQELYIGLRQDPVLVSRAINCVGTKRGKVPELLIYPKSRTTLHAQWDKVIEECGFGLDGHATFEVTSRRVSDITHKQPRLIAKMDSREELPYSLASKHYFVLPVTERKYALVPGEGYHNLEDPNATPKSYEAARQVPVTVALKAGESAAIQTALYSGLLEEVVGVPRLRPTLHNDMIRLKGTRIHYGNAWSLAINGAQVEVDAGFENHEEFFLFECKNWYRGQLRNFNVRQLFFPQIRALNDLRAAGRDWKVRCFFLNVEPDTSIYRFWEYAFHDDHDYSSMYNVAQSAYELVQRRGRQPPQLLEQLASIAAVKTDYIPQANDPTKVLALLQGVAEGYNTVPDVAARFRFDPRQSHYYGEAAEEIGLLERTHGGLFSLTGEGAKIAALRTDEATHALIEQIFTLPVFHEIAAAAIRSKKSVVDSEALLVILKACSKGRYNETTLHRRSQSVARWVNWIGETTGTIRVRPAPRIRPELRSLDSY